jgi:hypothetical protein
MKKINNKGLLSIRINNDNKMCVVFKPVNGTVWMERNELCELFGCYMKGVDRCLGDIFERNSPAYLDGVGESFVIFTV